MTEKEGEALHAAVKRADLNGIRKALAAGHSANALDSDGLPPLAYLMDHYDCYGFVLTGEMREMIRLLREAGADPSLKGAAAHAIAMARREVSSAIENGDCQRFEALLGW